VCSVDTKVRIPLVLHVTRHWFVEVAYQLFVSYQASTQPTPGLGGWL
jgi:hypothetical protein